MPVYGSADIRCINCKMSFRKHSAVAPHPLDGNEKTCPAFKTHVSCICKFEYHEHKTLFETRDQRIKKGKAVGNDCRGFAISGYSNEIETN